MSNKNVGQQNYYDNELGSLEDNPGDLSSEYIAVMTGEMSPEDYETFVQNLSEGS